MNNNSILDITSLGNVIHWKPTCVTLRIPDLYNWFYEIKTKVKSFNFQKGAIHNSKRIKEYNLYFALFICTWRWFYSEVFWKLNAVLFTGAFVSLFFIMLSCFVFIINDYWLYFRVPPVPLPPLQGVPSLGLPNKQVNTCDESATTFIGSSRAVHQSHARRQMSNGNASQLGTSMNQGEHQSDDSIVRGDNQSEGSINNARSLNLFTSEVAKLLYKVK